MPANSRNSLIFIHPLNSSFSSIIVPRRIWMIIKKIYPSDCTHFSRSFHKVIKFSFIIFNIVIGVCIKVIIMRTAVFLPSWKYMIAVNITKIIIQTFCTFRCLRIWKLTCRIKIFYIFICRLDCKIIKHCVAPVSLKLNSIYTCIKHYYTAWCFLKGKVVHKADFALINPVDIKILNLFICVIRLTIADWQLIKTCLLYRNINTYSCTLLVKIRKCTSWSICEVKVLTAAVLSRIAFPCFIINLAAICFAIFKFHFYNRISCINKWIYRSIIAESRKCQSSCQ